MVFFTDVREARQCSTCETFEEIAVDDLESEILRLYGPAGTGQVTSRELASYSMADLAAYLGEDPPVSLAPSLAGQYLIDIELEAAEWIVFSVLKSTDEIYGSNALKLLLDRRPDLLQSKRVVVFAYDVPYSIGRQRDMPLRPFDLDSLSFCLSSFHLACFPFFRYMLNANLLKHIFSQFLIFYLHIVHQHR